MGRSLLGVVFIGVLACTYAEELERVVDGRDAVIGEFRYQVALWYKGVFQCGGSIISNRHILTAVHCLYRLTAPPYDGLEIFTGAVTPNGGNSYKVKNVVLYHDYSTSSVDSYIHDIAVIRLRDWTEMTQYCKDCRARVALVGHRSGMSVTILSFGKSCDNPSLPYQMLIDIATYDPDDQSVAQLSGCGRTGFVSPYPKTVQKANVTIISNEIYQSKVMGTIYETQLCAFGGINHGACSGGSGGPLAFNKKLVGIVSWSYPCAMGGPDVYTRVFKYRDFIFNTVKNMIN